MSRKKTIISIALEQQNHSAVLHGIFYVPKAVVVMEEEYGHATSHVIVSHTIVTVLVEDRELRNGRPFEAKARNSDYIWLAFPIPLSFTT
jgi:hypothetical protein